MRASREQEHRPVDRVPEQLLVPRPATPQPPPPPPLQENEVLLPRSAGTIILPHYKRVPNTSRHCIFQSCARQSGHLVPMFIKKVLLLKQYHLFVPTHCRICETHLYGDEWTLLNDNTNLTSSFTSEQIENLIRIAERNADYISHYITNGRRRQ